MEIDEVKFKIIKQGDTAYIAATKLNDYLKVRSGNAFVGANQRTIRIYKDEGILLDSKKSGRDIYFELEDTYSTLMIVYYLNFRDFKKEDVKNIILKARGCGQLLLYALFLEIVFSRKTMNFGERKVLLEFLTKVQSLDLETKDPVYGEFVQEAMTK